MPLTKLTTSSPKGTWLIFKSTSLTLCTLVNNLWRLFQEDQGLSGSLQRKRVSPVLVD